MKISKVDIPCITNENKKKFYIYGIKNKISDKYYIGSCTNKRGISDRFRRHIYYLRNNQHHSIKFQRSFNKNNKSFDIWEFILFEETNKIIYKQREQYYIDKYNSYYNGYNSTPFVGIINYGSMSEKHKNAISNSKQNLLDSDIINIFKKYNDGLNYKEIGIIYNLSPPTISNIINKKHYYLETKNKYGLSKKRYSYVFYDLKNNKLYKVDNFTKFCRKNELNDKMMMPLMLGKFKKTFINGWTVFRHNEFNLNNLKKRIIIENSHYSLYKDGIKYEFKSVKDFCKKYKLDETSIYHVLNNKRNIYKGYHL